MEFQPLRRVEIGTGDHPRPSNGVWMVYGTMGIFLKWMRTGGTPISIWGYDWGVDHTLTLFKLSDYPLLPLAC